MPLKQHHHAVLYHSVPPETTNSCLSIVGADVTVWLKCVCFDIFANSLDIACWLILTEDEDMPRRRRNCTLDSSLVRWSCDTACTEASQCFTLRSGHRQTIWMCDSHD